MNGFTILSLLEYVFFLLYQIFLSRLLSVGKRKKALALTVAFELITAFILCGSIVYAYVNNINFINMLRLMLISVFLMLFIIFQFFLRERIPIKRGKTAICIILSLIISVLAAKGIFIIEDNIKSFDTPEQAIEYSVGQHVFEDYTVINEGSYCFVVDAKSDVSSGIYPLYYSQKDLKTGKWSMLFMVENSVEKQLDSESLLMNTLILCKYMSETDKCFVLAENRNDILKFMKSVTDKNGVSFEPIFTKEDIEKGETIPTFFYDVLDCENGKVEIKINGASRTIDVSEK